MIVPPSGLMDWNPDYRKIGMEGLTVQEAPGVAQQGVAGELFGCRSGDRALNTLTSCPTVV